MSPAQLSVLAAAETLGGWCTRDALRRAAGMTGRGKAGSFSNVLASLVLAGVMEAQLARDVGDDRYDYRPSPAGLAALRRRRA